MTTINFLLIFLSAALACSKVTVQGRLAKRSVKNINDSILMTCLIFFFVVKGVNKEPVNFRLNKVNIGFVFAVGALLGLFQYVYTYANSVVDAVVLVPTANGLTTLFQMLTGKLLFKEVFPGNRLCPSVWAWLQLCL